MTYYKLNSDGETHKLEVRFVRTETIEVSSLNYLQEELVPEGEAILDATKYKDDVEKEYYQNDELLDELNQKSSKERGL